MAKINSQLLTTMGTLGEALKLPSRNKKMFFFITIFTMIPYSLLVLANALFLVPILKNMSKIASPLLNMDPKSPEYMKHVLKLMNGSILLISVEMFFLLLTTLVSLWSMVATVYVSALSYLGMDLTVRDLSRKVKKTWIKSFITEFYFSLMNAGFILLILALLTLVLISSRSLIVLAIGVLLLLLAVSVHAYFILVGMLSLVTSVLDDCYGLQALGKAETLVKGKKVAGVFLTLLLMLLFAGIYLGLAVINNLNGVGFWYLDMCDMVNLAILVKMVSMMVYTVFYCERKQSYGEEVETEDNCEYATVSKTLLVGSAGFP